VSSIRGFFSAISIEAFVAAVVQDSSNLCHDAASALVVVLGLGLGLVVVVAVLVVVVAVLWGWCWCWVIGIILS
jgi:hypothetical protein